jgi:hypothetical protein
MRNAQSVAARKIPSSKNTKPWLQL